ncbi:MAG: hypothetical protein KGJ86_11935 [Chloroflexota bacterium]|nr:hypothetical protein [Chloroflexota bacterium]
MELKRYVALIRKGWWIVALVTVVAMMAAYGISKATTPMFRATTTLKAGASLGGNGNASEYIALSQGLLSQYAAELDSATLADKVNQALKLDMPVEKLQSEIKAVPVNQNFTIQVNVEDKDPNHARDIANKLDELFLQQQQADATKTAAVLGNQQDVVLVSVVDPARTPIAPFKPKTRINVAAAAILGLAVGVLLVFLIDWLDDTVGSVEEAEALLETRTLAAIPQVQRPRARRRERESIRSAARGEVASTFSRR